MQPIERVGVFALLFLVVMVIAVWQFDRQPDGIAKQVAAQGRSSTAQGGATAKPTEVPQLGQTTAGSRNRKAPASKPAASDWKSRKADRDASASKRKENPQVGALPLSKPGQSLTPAPKPSPKSRNASDRRVPTNKPTGRSLKPSTAEGSKSKTSRIGNQSQSKAQSKPRSAETNKSGPVAQYTVAAGDTLSEIALRELGTSKRWKEIAQLNGVNASALKVGTKLRMPAREAGSTVAKSVPKAAKPAATTAAKTAGTKYRVASGDSLWTIAQKQLGNGARYGEIAALNPTLNPNKLIVGAALVMPGDAAPIPASAIAKSTPARSKKASKKPRVR